MWRGTVWLTTRYSSHPLKTLSKLADISKINAVALANIAKLDAVLAANIAKVNGLVFASAPGFVGLLDTYTGAAAGYSTRRLASSATNLMRIREDSGDTETDIGYDSNGDLDTAAIATHCGTANGFVVSWVDQSGNANNADQSTSGSQPQIYNGTAVITENGKPAIRYQPSTDDSKLVMDTAVSAVTMSVVVKVDVQNASSNSYLWSDTLYTSGSGFHAAGGSGSRTGYGVQIISPTVESFQGTVEDLNQHLITYHDGTTDTLYQDGTSYATGTLANTPSIQRIGSRGINTLSLKGKLQEIVLYDTATRQADRTGIETDINTYFSIF